MENKVKRVVTALAETFNASLSAQNAVNSLTGNSWNSLASVELTSPEKLAFKIFNRPRGLMSFVGSPREGVQASPLPSEDYLLSRNFHIKAKHVISVDDLLKATGRKLTDNVGNSSVLTQVVEDKGFSEVLTEYLRIASQSLQTKAFNQIAKIVGDALNGSVTLTADNGLTEAFTFTKLDSAAALPLWSVPATATPLANMLTVNIELAGLANNYGQDLQFGTTFSSSEAFSALLATDEIKNQIAIPLFNGNVSPFNVTPETFNTYFNSSTLPIFGTYRIDGRANYEADNGSITRFFSTGYIYCASGTERLVAGGLPQAPINIQIVPPDLTGTPIGGVISANNTGFNIKLIEIKPVRDGEQTTWEMVATGKIVITQFKPWVRKQVI